MRLQKKAFACKKSVCLQKTALACKKSVCLQFF
jgi:hypothetical protein